MTASRLLRQPSGFEGLGVSCELADATDAPGAEVVERPDLGGLHLDAGRPPGSGVPNRPATCCPTARTSSFTLASDHALR